MSPKKHPSRKRGAQPGNTNALKHGFYSPSLRLPPAADHTLRPITDLSGDIAFLRAFLNHVLSLSAAVDRPTLEQQLALLRVITPTTNTMARLVYNQHLIRRATDPRVAEDRQWLEDLLASGQAPPILTNEH